MSPLRTLVVDDEELARRRLLTLLRDEPEVEVVGECRNGREAVAAIEEREPDLVFLDVQMPEVDGFAVLDAVGPERMPAVVFVTAYDQYALRAFEVQALDYLLKPFARDRFRQTLERVRSRIGGPAGAREAERGPELARLLDELGRQGRHLDRLVVRSGPGMRFVRVDEVDWIGSEGNYLRLHAGAEEHLVRGTIKSIEARLDPRRFLRVDRATVVNLDRVREIQPWFGGEYVLILADGTRLHSGWGQARRIRELLRNPL